MSFPQVAATNTSTQTANTTTHTVNLPAGIASGDLLIVFFAKDGDGGANNVAGWTTLGTAAVLNNLQLIVFYRIADGTEAGTITVTTPDSERSAHQSYRIADWHGVTAPSMTGNSATDPAADPANHTPSWGAADTLWLIAAVSDANTTFSADPANYTDPIENNSTGTNDGVKLRTLRRNLTAASEDPGTFTNTDRPWATETLAVRPPLSAFGRRAFRGGP